MNESLSIFVGRAAHAAQPQGGFVSSKTSLEHLVNLALAAKAEGRIRQLKRSVWALELLHAVIPPEKHRNGRPHPMPLNEAAVEVIKRKVGQHPTHVFTFRGKPVTQVSTKAWRDALVRAGIDNFRWHDLRHTFAT